GDPDGCSFFCSGAAAHREERVLRHPLAAQVQGLARALRDAHAQATHRHPRPHTEDGRFADATRAPGGRRYRDQALKDAPIMAKEIKGVLGEKLGMTQVFDESNRIVPVTVVKAGPCVVTLVRTPDADGYSAVQLAYGQVDPRKVNKPSTGHFATAGVTPRRYI